MKSSAQEQVLLWKFRIQYLGNYQAKDEYVWIFQTAYMYLLSMTLLFIKINIK